MAPQALVARALAAVVAPALAAAVAQPSAVAALLAWSVAAEPASAEVVQPSGAVERVSPPAVAFASRAGALVVAGAVRLPEAVLPHPPASA